MYIHSVHKEICTLPYVCLWLDLEDAVEVVAGFAFLSYRIDSPKGRPADTAKIVPSILAVSVRKLCMLGIRMPFKKACEGQK